MGTRGFLGFVVDGEEKITYNHFDSYPSGLGVDMLKWLRGAVLDMDSLRAAVNALRVVSDDQPPTDADIEHLRQFANLRVGEQSERSWYCLLRGTQGKPGAILQAGAIEGAPEFPLDSLFAEYGYIVDLDAGTFEAYRGFQREQHDKGRFAARGNARGDYFPCALVASWPLAELPSDDDLEAAYTD